MHKTRRSFRLSPESIATLQKYTLDHKLETTTEALEQILRGLCSFLSPSEQGSPVSGASDLLPCKQRIGTDPNMACLNPPTLYRKVKITEINAEICRACQVLSKNLPDKYQVTPTPEQTLQVTETPEQVEKANSDPSNSTRKNAGMVWCPEGLYVFPLKCDRCREQTYRQWYECHTEKLKKKGEEQRARQPT